MNYLTYLVYTLILGLIRAYKLLELQFLKLFNPLIRHMAKAELQKIGIVVHCPGDPKWTEADSKRVLSKCASKYDSLIHFKVKDVKAFPILSNGGSTAFGELYMDNILDISGNDEKLTQAQLRVLESKLLEYYYNWWNCTLEWLELFAFNLQTKKRAFQVGVAHYDLGNKLFEKMLDPWMQYTCGYWKDASDLNTAQINKMKLIGRKLYLKPGMRILDIGCGWGALCKYLAENYQVECVGITIGEEGAKYGNNICKGLPVEIRVQDYRDLSEQFDRVVSVGMFEHVGVHNHREFFKVAKRCLKDDGIFLLHTIGRDSDRKFFGGNTGFIHKYIFPNGYIPSPLEIVKGIQNIFVIEDWHNFGQDYAKTLNSWRENFIESWPEIKEDYDERFYRMWVLYLSSCRAMFLSRHLHLYQIVLRKEGIKNEYRAVR